MQFCMACPVLLTPRLQPPSGPSPWTVSRAAAWDACSVLCSSSSCCCCTQEESLWQLSPINC